MLLGGEVESTVNFQLDRPENQVFGDELCKKLPFNLTKFFSAIGC